MDDIQKDHVENAVIHADKLDGADNGQRAITMWLVGLLLFMADLTTVAALVAVFVFAVYMAIRHPDCGEDDGLGRG